MAVLTNNFQAEYGNRSGIVVNIVTKSGGNVFKGGVFVATTDDSMTGDESDGNDLGIASFDELTYGATVGGPVVKDQLFFFANYEKFKRCAPGPDIVNTPYGRGQITDADIAAIQAAARGHNFDAGSLVGAEAADTNIEEYAVKLDWNINDQHRANLRFARTEQDETNGGSFGGYSATGLQLTSAWYTQKKKIDTLVGQWFADWTDKAWDALIEG